MTESLFSQGKGYATLVISHSWALHITHYVKGFMTIEEPI
jgi:hypothetical protein